MVIMKNGILVGDDHGLSDYALMTAFRNSRFLKHYQFKDELTRQTASMENK